MKKFLFLIICGLIVVGNANADHHCKECHCKMDKGGFVNTDEKPMSIAEIDKLPDDAYVVAKGNIVKRISDDKYEFSDGKKTITIKVGNKVWKGQKITPKDEIMIVGEVDKDFASKEIKVKSIKKM